MSEERAQYRAGVLNPEANSDKLVRKDCAGFVEVRTRRNKLIFRFDPSRMLVEWRDGPDAELIDLMPYLTG